ncbi:hypothetical protein EMIHUDRAFT_437575 [Emiliania huxleyi CCMP1516]|uniref:ABM domain-containing protein n=2 Tax=Emiliania huxleyi TaxID=2903 RepID=A0A0D3IK13_EMIH1|nr:hypothetical protein EMIHUDRAFT_437575 [Emiliania huxleyi CCMP1516]EOD11598.1 hypothetical protein EMIHUDRAFT_437575 [Emiliania huxleyi CCMP1516]|eukprot:XP_005764027.1 hypothetical protein EMIHUDRAFT_437575 [Emiliania huxleyi CCMP1516]
MLRTALSRSSLARSAASRGLPRAAAPRLARGLASDADGEDGVHVDMVARMWSCKVKDDPGAYQMDLVFDSFIDKASQVEGVVGASRLLCKSYWDYKLILKFEETGALKRYLAENGEHDALMREYLPQIEKLTIDGKVHQQSFVYDDIE